VEIFRDTVTQDKVIVVGVLTYLHVCMNEVKQQEGMENYMEIGNDDFSATLESIIDRMPPRQMTILEYNVPVMANSTSSSLNEHSPTYIFYDRFVFSIFDRMMQHKLVAMEDSSSIYNWKEKFELKEKNILQ
jgi:hypothetical protein